MYRYIGPVSGHNEMIGVELNSWSPDAKDGRYDGFRYFTSPDGRGIFVTRAEIVDVIPLENDPDIKRGIDRQIKPRKRSGLLDLDGDAYKKLMNNNDTDSDNYDSDDDNDAALGETIELRSGKIGTIRFIGPVHFAKG